MSIFDIVITCILIFSLIRGFLRGLIIEMATLLAVVLGIYMAIGFSENLSNFLKNQVQWEERYIELTAFVSIVFIVAIGVMFLGKILTKITQFAALGFLNRLLGALFSVIKTSLIVGSVFMFSEQLQLLNAWHLQMKEQSYLYAPIMKINHLLYDNVLNEISIIEPKNKNNQNI